MAKTIGFNIALGGDASGLNKALKEVNAQISKSSNALKSLQQLTKLDPSNLMAYKVKHAELGNEILKTREKLELLQSKKAEVDQAFADGKISAKEWSDYYKEIEQTKKKLAELEAQYSTSMPKVEAFGQTLQNVGKQLADMGKKIESAGKSITNVGKSLQPMSAVFQGLTVASVKFATDFEDGMAKVYTIADDSVVPMKDMKQSLIELSNESGVATTELAEGMYEALSASVDTADALEFTATASDLARAGFLETAESVDVLTTIINAYGKETDEARQIANQLVEVQDRGKVTVQQLAQNMGNVIPTASSYKVSLEDLNTAYALITERGVGVAKATTQMERMFLELGDSGSTVAGILQDKTGQSFSELMESGYSLKDVITVLSDSVGGSQDKFNELWSSSVAGQGALNLLQISAESYDEELNKITNTSTKLDSNLETLNTSSYQFKSALNELKNSASILGETILVNLTPTLESIGSGIENLATWFNNLDPNMQSAIANFTLFMACLAPVIMVVGQVVEKIGLFTTNLGSVITKVGELVATHLPSLVTLIGSISAPVLAVIAVITAVVSALVYLYNTNQEVHDKINGILTQMHASFSVIFGKIQEVIQILVDFISSAIEVIVNVVTGLFDTIQPIISVALDFISSLISNCFTIINGLLDVFIGLFTGDWERFGQGIGSIIRGCLDTIKSIFQNGFNAVMAFIGTFVSGAVSVFNGFKNTINSIFKAVGDFFTDPIGSIKSAWDGLKKWFGSLFKGFNISLPSIKLPHFSISPAGWGIGDLLKGSIPKLSIQWYAKAMDRPYVLDGAQIFGMMNGKLLGGGERGEEVITSKEDYDSRGKTINITNEIVVNATEGMNENELADRVAKKIAVKMRRQFA